MSLYERCSMNTKFGCFFVVKVVLSGAGSVKCSSVPEGITMHRRTDDHYTFFSLDMLCSATCLLSFSFSVNNSSE